MNKKVLKQISELINTKIRIGMVLMLGDKTLKCVDTLDTDRGTRYIFDNGMGWTKSNIESNVALAVQKGNEWSVS